jgi:hypothetical protein
VKNAAADSTTGVEVVGTASAVEVEVEAVVMARGTRIAAAAISEGPSVINPYPRSPVRPVRLW